MARVSLRTTRRSMFLPVRTVSDASGLCRCSINVPFVVWELTVNNNNDNNDILIHLLQRKIFNLQMQRLRVHLDTCIYFWGLPKTLNFLLNSAACGSAKLP